MRNWQLNYFIRFPYEDSFWFLPAFVDNEWYISWFWKIEDWVLLLIMKKKKTIEPFVYKISENMTPIECTYSLMEIFTNFQCENNCRYLSEKESYFSETRHMNQFLCITFPHFSII